MGHLNLKEIAQLAGVSPSTVSLVLKGKPGAGEETRHRVTALLEQNGYHITPAEPAAKEKGSIRFLKYAKHAHLVNGNAGFVSSIIDAVEEETRRTGYNLVMTSVDEDNFEQVFEMVQADPLQGIIFMATEADTEIAHRLQRLRVPVVAVDNPMEFIDCNCVDMNNEEASHKTVEHLVMLGHKRIGYFFNSMPSNNCRARFAAYRRALEYFGLPFYEEDVLTTPPNIEGTYAAVLAMLEGGKALPGAMMATNDTIAIGAMNAMSRFGLRIPEDVSVVGFDDIIFAPAADPPLTTVNVNCKNIGMWAVRLLCDHIRYPASPCTKIMIGTQLVLRKSTCPPAVEA